MFTVNLVKNLLESNDITIDDDALYESISHALQSVRNYTNQYFLTKTHLTTNLSVSTNSITVTEPHPFKVGDWIEFLNSENNTNIYLVSEVSDSVITVKQTLSEELVYDTLIKLSFKGINSVVLAGMINYDYQNALGSYITQQNLNGYSVTYATGMEHGLAYPKVLYGGVNHLRKLNDDYSEYHKYGYKKRVI